MNKIRDSAIAAVSLVSLQSQTIPRLMVRLLTCKVGGVEFIMTVSARRRHLWHRLSKLVTIAVYLMRLVLTALLFEAVNCRYR